jgi:cbb3-type cytochrome oxidase subunit 3
MSLLGQCVCVDALRQIDPVAMILLLQLLGLIYVAFAFRRIARNQMELATYLKDKLDKKD